ncbi:MAG TPA: 3-phosphoshikimate 1-carboxyvinyltransferase [Xanthobacteraceae bacterium]|nr:3-phosphoshikimate 1-carboxyvinyltransferase [Xanthobacteraceae bacterium]
MTDKIQIPTPLAAHRSPPLKGRARVPGDKSISHRALLVGLLAVGKTSVEGLLEGDDVLATARACRQFGASVERTGEGAWRIFGVGIGSLFEPAESVDFGNSGTGVRLAMGVAAGHPIEVAFDGDASLRRRPMRRVLEPVTRMGAEILDAKEGTRLPVRLRGARDPIPIQYETRVPSAQVKSAVLLCGLAAPGETIVIEREATRDHTERMLRSFGAKVDVERHGEHGRRITLAGRPELRPQALRVPADPSSAAFPLVAALLVPGSDLVLDGLLANPLRTGLIETLKEMGASIEELDRREESCEPIVDLRVRHSPLRGVEVPASRAPSMIDEYPVLAVAASFAQGTTVMRGLSELRVKESDRLAAVAAGLAANGVVHEIVGDDLIVHGKGRVAGSGKVATHMDHRIAMSFLVMGLASEQPVAVDDAAFIATSFPGFTELMRKLGADLR